ncbi:MAG: hypothetical protein KC441_01570 [Anaerolineales bacterium]|nr:hypothetical protein [Anaerolineales bacterium]
MKQLAILILLCLIGCSTPPTPQPELVASRRAEAAAPATIRQTAVSPTTVYLPVVARPRPLVADQRPGPEMCLAWSATFLDDAAADFGWQFFYHSATYARPGHKAVPIIRLWPADRSIFMTQLSALKAANYNGLVILANEPDRPDQDATPAEALAGLYWYATSVLPGCTFIVPNAISPAYLDEFLDHAVVRPQDRIGIHIYQGTAATAVHTWPATWLGHVEGILARHNVENRYWISEFGIAEAWPLTTATRYATEILNSRAEVVCVYTTSCGSYTPGCGYDLYTPTGAMTRPGQALQSVLSSPLPPAAYP